MTRPTPARYKDPLEVIWTVAASRLGLRIVRSDAVYAAWDGKGTLTLSTAEHFDPDDSLAQHILHELCHALVEGEAAFGLPDWGLDNMTSRDVVREYACQRLQCALATRHGLRDFFGSTTEYRSYWDTLPEDPLDDVSDPATSPARAGFVLACQAPYAEVLTAALEATRVIVAAVFPFAEPDSLYATSTVSLSATSTVSLSATSTV